MTTNTHGRADAGSGEVIEHAETDLESRIKARRGELIDKLGGLRGDKRPEAAESRNRLKAKLSELAHIMKWGVADGWASVGTPLTDKLEEWLAEAAHQLTARYDQV